MKKNRITVVSLILLISLWFQSCENPVGSSNFLATPGPILFMCTKSGTSQPYSMNPDGSNVQQLSNDSKFPIVDAKWSPDGKKVAVESPVGGIPIYGDAIYVENSDGSSRYLATRKSMVVMYDSTVGDTVAYRGALGPVWSPDSKQIAYIRHRLAEPLYSSDIFVVDVDGQNERRITDSPKIEKDLVDWSPDGNYLLAALTNDLQMDSVTGLPPRSAVLYNLQGMPVMSWVPSKAGAGPFSRGGSKIAYGEPDGVYVMDADGSNPQRVASDPPGVYLSPVCWSPDDSEILCDGSEIDVENRIFIINMETGTVTEITPFKNYDGYEFATDWRR